MGRRFLRRGSSRPGRLPTRCVTIASNGRTSGGRLRLARKGSGSSDASRLASMPELVVANSSCMRGRFASRRTTYGCASAIRVRTLFHSPIPAHAKRTPTPARQSHILSAMFAGRRVGCNSPLRWPAGRPQIKMSPFSCPVQSVLTVTGELTAGGSARIHTNLLGNLGNASLWSPIQYGTRIGNIQFSGYAGWTGGFEDNFNEYLVSTH